MGREVCDKLVPHKKKGNQVHSYVFYYIICMYMHRPRFFLMLTYNSCINWAVFSDLYTDLYIPIFFSSSLFSRCEVLIGLVVLWNRYEAEVKGLLDWITTEANSFSKEVTTRDEKGVEDHIESCKVCAYMYSI